MNIVKVKQTEAYKDGQVDTIVCTGKLALAHTNEAPNKVGQIIYCLETNPICYSTITSEESLLDKNNTLRFWKQVKPIIIFETEEIEVGDWGYKGDIIRHFTEKEMEFTSTEEMKSYKKILALPENFSPEQLRMIVTCPPSKEFGDAVLVECEEYEPENDGLYFYIIKLTNNHITLFPANKEISCLTLRDEEIMITITKKNLVKLVANVNTHWQTEKYPYTYPMVDKWLETNNPLTRK